MVSSSSTWRASAAYLYLLHLDGAALAWEYLRRHPEYRRDWQERSDPNALHWGLSSLENPHLDARFAQPLWRPHPAGLVRLTGSDEPILNLERFNLWRLPGRKSLIHDGRVLLLILVLGSQVLRVALAPSVTEGSAFAYVIPATANASLDWKEAQRFGALIEAPPGPNHLVSAVGPTRGAIFRMRSLQALDGTLAGASHREIATVLFGLRRVAKDWHPDSELRAQTRHCIARARALMRGGYRALLRLAPEGDESTVRESPSRRRSNAKRLSTSAGLLPADDPMHRRTTQ